MVWSPNIRIGYLSQEPELDEDLTVYENILEGIEDKLDILDRQEEVRYRSLASHYNH